MKRLITIILLAAMAVPAFSQEKSEQEAKEEKEFYEYIEKQIEHLEAVLNLESWQVFYADSILTHNTRAMQDELKALQAKKVSNTDIYYDVQYKWQDANYDAFHKILNEEQWAKYLKDGAARSKKARDKARAKKQNAKAKK